MELGALKWPPAAQYSKISAAESNTTTFPHLSSEHLDTGTRGGHRHPLQHGTDGCVNAGTQERPPELRRRRCRDKDRGAQYQRDRNYSSRHKRCDANLANARLDLAFL